MFLQPTTARKLLGLLLGVLLTACVPVSTSGGASTPRVESVPAGQPAPVDSLTVEIGLGSPIPVQVVIDSTFPDPCAQLVAVQQSQAGGIFEIAVLTSAAEETCASPAGPLPFRFAIPLNAAGLGPGTYTVAVNGETTTFTYPPAAGQ